MIRVICGASWLRSAGWQYFVCHDCGVLIPLEPWRNSAEQYPVIADDGGIKYRCAACREDPPTRVRRPLPAKIGDTADVGVCDR